MIIRHRKMTLQDIPDCVSFVVSQPALRARYPSMDELARAWAKLIDDEFACMLLYEEISRARSTIWGVSIAAFVRQSFVREIKTPPFFWIGPELARRVNSASSPVLSSKEIREANSTNGLNLVVFQGNILPAKPRWLETYYAGVKAFFEEYRGYQIKEIIGSQADTPEFLSSMLHSGAMLFQPELEGRINQESTDLEQVVKTPHVVTLSPETARLLGGSWFSSVFDYHPPIMKLSPSQQRLLLFALRGDTDQILAEKLHISVPAVKKAWATIYEKTERYVPELAKAPDDNQIHEGSGRGAERKRHVIAYVRENIQELRPVFHELISRRIVRGTGVSE
jgi:hypothetical protein